MAGQSGGGGSQTVTQTQQIPAYEQQFSQENQDLARSLASNPYPQYQGQLVQGFSPTQQQGQNMAVGASNAYQPGLTNAYNDTTFGGAQNPLVTQGANALQFAGQAPSYYGTGINDISKSAGATPYGYQGSTYLMGSTNQSPLVGQGASDIQRALGMGANNPGVLQSFMSPYVQQALAPQMLSAQTQLGQQQNQINAQAAGANAFGDARQGVENALQNYYGNQTMAGIQAQGYNTAFSNALQAAQAQQGLGLQAGGALMGAGGQQQQIQQGAGQALANYGTQEQQIQQAAGNAMASQGLSEQQLQANIGQQLAAMGGQQQGLELQAGNQWGQLGQLAQSLGLQGANAVYDVGAQQQQLGQQELNTAYQQFQNQAQWPYQMLNIRESALSNSPYSIANQTTLPQANMTAQGLGAFASLAGLLGGGMSGGSMAPYGGQAFH